MASREITERDGSLPTGDRTSRTEPAFGAIITARATKFLAVFRVVLGLEFPHGFAGGIVLGRVGVGVGGCGGCAGWR